MRTGKPIYKRKSLKSRKSYKTGGTLEDVCEGFDKLFKNGQQEVDPLYVDQDGNTLFLVLCSHGCVKQVRRMLDKYPHLDLWARNKDNMSALDYVNEFIEHTPVSSDDPIHITYPPENYTEIKEMIYNHIQHTTSSSPIDSIVHTIDETQHEIDTIIQDTIASIKQPISV
jgi:hypothetical protein